MVRYENSSVLKAKGASRINKKKHPFCATLPAKKQRTSLIWWASNGVKFSKIALEL
jgi:hypothetical protein